jgi:predicted GTPase
MGAAGKDFHVFNTMYRDRPAYEVCAFTATQIPNIDDRRYPAALAGKLYPKGIPIHPEAEVASLVKRFKIRTVVFAYSDVSYEYIAERERIARKAGADFLLPDPYAFMLPSSKPVIAVCAVRTGSGKSATSRRVLEILKRHGVKAVVVRHPMPYGDLTQQRVQRFATLKDLAKHRCTVEEMEEYEPHLRRGNVVYAGVDYAAILKAVEAEADVIVWDGGNNDLPFFRPDLHFVIVDPHRPGHELNYYPGRVNFSMAHVVLVNKIKTAPPVGVRTVLQNIRRHNPKAILVKADLEIAVSGSLKGLRVLAVEDGPTLTHGDMKYGAAVIAARRAGATLVDPRPYLAGSLKDTFRKYPDIGRLLPAMGYGEAQIHDMERTIAGVPCDVVAIGTPVDLTRLMAFNKPTVRVNYALKEIGHPSLDDIISKWRLLPRKTR